jgi:hypothetical protein
MGVETSANISNSNPSLMLWKKVENKPGRNHCAAPIENRENG